MLRKLRKRIKGQSTAEYAILIALVVAAVIGMQTYVKRAINARLKGGTDYMIAQVPAFGADKQYEPYYLNSSYVTARNSTSSTRTVGGTIVDQDGSDSSSNAIREKGGYDRSSYTPGGTMSGGMK